MGFQFIMRRAGPHHLDARHLRFQHQVVNLALGFRVPAVDGKRAGDVRRVTFVFSAGIDQQQFAIAQFAVVVDVVQHGGVRARADD